MKTVGQHSAVQQLFVHTYVCIYVLYVTFCYTTSPKYVRSSERRIKESPDSLVGRLHGISGTGAWGEGVSGVSEAFNAELVPQGVVVGHLHLPAILCVHVQPKCLC